MYYNDDSLPKFFHNREPKIVVNKQNSAEVISKGIKSPRPPLEMDTLRSIFHRFKTDFSQPQHKKINLKQTLLNHVAYQLNLEESLTNNYFGVPKPKLINVLLIDTSFSMKRISSQLFEFIDQINYDIILYHDVNIYKFSFNHEFEVEYKGGTSHSIPLEQLLKINHETNTLMNITHLSDGEISNRDLSNSKYVIEQMKEIGCSYQWINPQYNVHAY